MSAGSIRRSHRRAWALVAAGSLTLSFALGACSAESDDQPAPSQPTQSDQSARSGESTRGAPKTAGPDAPATKAAPTMQLPAEVTLAVVGDVMLGRGVGSRIANEGTRAPLADVRKELRGADLTIGNLESPLSDRGTPETHKKWAFRGDPDSVEVLEDGGFDVVSLANNHTLDYGVTAMEDTERILDDAGIVSVGVGEDRQEAHEPAIVERHGMRLAFLSYLEMPVERGGFDTHQWEAGSSSPGLAWADDEQIKKDVEAVAPDVDHVIVLLHSGWENTSQVNDQQRGHAQAAFDGGATLVLGAHPHVLQGFHLDKRGRLVVYSLGNFVFDAATTQTNESMILHLTLDRDGVTDMELTPVRIVNGFPTLLTGAAGRDLVDRFESLPVH